MGLRLCEPHGTQAGAGPLGGDGFLDDAAGGRAADSRRAGGRLPTIGRHPLTTTASAPPSRRTPSRRTLKAAATLPRR